MSRLVESQRQRSLPWAEPQRRGPAPRQPMDVLIGLLQRLFALHNGIYRLTGVDRLLPHRPPPVSPDETASGGEWSYLDSQRQRLFYRRWLDAEQPDAALLVVHGVAAHGGDLRVIGEYLAPRRLATYAVDLPGHGLSEGERGALHDTERVLEAIADTVAFIGREHPGRPIYLLGQSLAPSYLLALAARLRLPVAPAGLVLAGPDLAPRQTQPAPEGAPLWQQLARYVHYGLYGLLLSRWPVVDMTGREEPTELGRQQAERAKGDPLRTNQLSIQTVIEAYRLIRGACRVARRVHLPTLIVQGEADRATDPAAARCLRDALASRDRELVYVPDAHHGLFAEPATPRVLAAIGGWLERQTAAEKRP